MDLLEAFREADRPETLYYRTDHHWTTAGAYRAYARRMEEKQASSVPQEAFAVERAPGFYGTSYAKSGLWLTRPDEIALWSDPALHAVTTVYDGDGRAPVSASTSAPHRRSSCSHFSCGRADISRSK